MCLLRRYVCREVVDISIKCLVEFLDGVLFFVSGDLEKAGMEFLQTLLTVKAFDLLDAFDFVVEFIELFLAIL